ncbi:MAG: methyltransferase domain-containing protein [Aquificota bacterium]|nr:MAG: methyltransferase domain-containing protein [Aquificota bacterium]
MNKDKEKWNEKYLKEDFPWDSPSEIVEKFYRFAPEGKALDIACGLGRNSIFLAEKGFQVDAVDISDVALKKLQGKKHINPIEADLDIYNIEKNRYSLIININYLNRRLFPQIKEGLINGGVLIFETFTLHEEEGFMHPKNRDFLLRKNELLHSFCDMYIIYYQEKVVTKPDGEKAFISSLVAKKECTL